MLFMQNCLSFIVSSSILYVTGTRHKQNYSCQCLKGLASEKTANHTHIKEVFGITTELQTVG